MTILQVQHPLTDSHCTQSCHNHSMHHSILAHLHIHDSFTHIHAGSMSSTWSQLLLDPQDNWRKNSDLILFMLPSKWIRDERASTCVHFINKNQSNLVRDDVALLSCSTNGSTCREVGPALCIWDPHFGKYEFVRGSAMVPLERAMVVSYKLSIVTTALSLTIQPPFAIKCLWCSNQQR